MCYVRYMHYMHYMHYNDVVENMEPKTEHKTGTQDGTQDGTTDGTTDGRCKRMHTYTSLPVIALMRPAISSKRSSKFSAM